MRILQPDEIETLRDLARALPGICRDQHGGRACDDCVSLAAAAMLILDKVEGKAVPSRLAHERPIHTGP